MRWKSVSRPWEWQCGQKIGYRRCWLRRDWGGHIREVERTLDSSAGTLVRSAMSPPSQSSGGTLGKIAVKPQVRDLRYNSGNLYPNCIIRHMLMKWTDHPPGLCEWGIRMALKGLGIRKCVYLGLGSCMFTIRYISIIFCYSIYMCYHWISWGSAHVSQPECYALHLNWMIICMSDCRCLDWKVASQIRQLPTSQPHILASR